MRNYETVPGFRDMFRCPVCKSVDVVEIHQPIIDKSHYCAVVECCACGAEFHQVYELQRVDVVRA